MVSGLVFDEDAFAFDVLKEVGPSGPFRGCEHTQGHCATAFFSPETGDTSTYEQWEEEGKRPAPDSALQIAAKRLDEYVPPPLDPATDEALRAFIAKRTQELGSSGG